MMLDAEATSFAGPDVTSAAKRGRIHGLAATSERRRAGEVSLKVPKLRCQTFETAIIERYRRRKSSVEEALIEMYLAGIGSLHGGHHRGALGHAGKPKHGPDLNKRNGAIGKTCTGAAAAVE